MVLIRLHKSHHDFLTTNLVGDPLLDPALFLEPERNLRHLGLVAAIPVLSRGSSVFNIIEPLDTLTFRLFGFALLVVRLQTSTIDFWARLESSRFLDGTKRICVSHWTIQWILQSEN